MAWPSKLLGHQGGNRFSNSKLTHFKTQISKSTKSLKPSATLVSVTSHKPFLLSYNDKFCVKKSRSKYKNNCEILTIICIYNIIKHENPDASNKTMKTMLTVNIIILWKTNITSKLKAVPA